MIAEIKMNSDEAIGFGKDWVSGIHVTMEDHVACMVVNDDVRVSCFIIYQAATFGDSVGSWF